MLCSGVLYHLPEPWKLIEQIGEIAPALFLWTHYARQGTETINGYDFWPYHEPDLTKSLSGLQPTSLWFTLHSLVDCLMNHYTEVRILKLDDIPAGLGVRLVALR